VSCDAEVDVCEIQSVDQVMQDHLTCGYEEKQEEVEVETNENKVSILMPFKTRGSKKIYPAVRYGGYTSDMQ
jgi:hypothetical protein